MAAAVALEDEGAGDADREAGERLSGALRQRDGSERPRPLPVRLHLPIRVDATHVDDAGGSVDVSPLEREPLFRPFRTSSRPTRSERRSRI